MMRTHGFTLIEIMVAMVIFSIISVMTFQGLQTSIQVQQRVENRATTFKEVQLLMNLLHQDFSNLVRRPVRAAFGKAKKPAFDINPPEQELTDKVYSDCRVEFTRIGSSNGIKELRAGLSRVAYCLNDDNDLYRLSWPILDRDQSSLPVESFLLSSVKEFSISLDEDGLKEWNQFCNQGENVSVICQHWLPLGTLTAVLVLENDETEKFEVSREFIIGMGVYLWEKG